MPLNENLFLIVNQPDEVRTINPCHENSLYRENKRTGRQIAYPCSVIIDELLRASNADA
jgi:hypothetical protein